MLDDTIRVVVGEPDAVAYGVCTECGRPRTTYSKYKDDHLFEMGMMCSADRSHEQDFPEWVTDA